MNDKMTARNTGISLLRYLFSFVAVVVHVEPDLSNDVQYFFYDMGPYIVPVFLFVSFYLIGGMMNGPKPQALRTRFLRILYPLVFWTLVYYVVLSLVRQSWIDYRQLFYSLLLGSARQLNPPMWFLAMQLYITGLVFVLCFLFPDSGKRDMLFLGLIAFCLAMQYSGANLYLLGDCAYESYYFFGKFFEVLPFALSALLFKKYESLLAGGKRLLLMAGLLLGAALGALLPEAPGLGCQGVPLLFITLLLCVTMISLPHVKSRRAAYWINELSQYTLGIYCMHVLMGQLLDGIVHHSALTLWKGTLIYDLIVWLLCLGASVLAGRMAKRIPRLKRLSFAVM